MNQILDSAKSLRPEKAISPAEPFEPYVLSEGAVTLESSLTAYGRGRLSFMAHTPTDKLEIPHSGALPEDWSDSLDNFIGDRSQFCALFLSYDFGAEICAGIRRSDGLSGVPRILAYKYDSVKILESGAVLEMPITRAISIPPEITTILRPDPVRYMHDVERIKRRIREGDIYQANLTGEWQVKSDIPPWDVYQNLRRLNPAQYAGFANLGDTTVISSSPERLFSVSGQNIRANPIKGTIALGQCEAETLRNKQRLLASAKDRAELLMIVDLLRNDLGKVCRYGTVRTHDIWKPEVYSSLIHLAGDIRGELKGYVRVSEIINALFPGGSISGAPKKRALEILAEIEGRPRGIYTGSFGYVYRDQIDLNIAIRTMTYHDGLYTIQAGGGIVADSGASAEYDEACLKARNLLRALSPELEP